MLWYPESILVHSFNSPVLYGTSIPKSWWHVLPDLISPAAASNVVKGISKFIKANLNMTQTLWMVQRHQQVSILKMQGLCPTIKDQHSGSRINPRFFFFFFEWEFRALFYVQGLKEMWSISVLIVVSSLFVAVPLALKLQPRPKLNVKGVMCSWVLESWQQLGMPTSQKVCWENFLFHCPLSYLLRWREKKGDQCLLLTKLRKVSDERMIYDSREPQRRRDDHFTQPVDMCFLREFYNFPMCIGKQRKEN